MLSRRFILAGASALVASGARSPDKPALLGGKPIRTEHGRRWPIINKKDESGWLDVLRSKQWNRRGGTAVAEFEQAWAAQIGTKHAIATNGGSTALLAALYALDVGPGDEVIVPPYTFIASVNSVLLRHALPVFVDTDRATLQIDASKIEAAITPWTRAIMPVQLGGSMADMDAVMAVAKKHNLAVIEDACQSHLAEWRGQKAGSIGDIGCFSFQASKNLNCGEGGAIVTNDDGLAQRASAFHNNSNPLHVASGGARQGVGSNLRLTEFQGALLVSQLARLADQAQRRERNATYLSGLLNEIPGVTPARMYDGCTRNAYHLYMFRYESAEFDGLPRSRFLEALKAEGVSASSGYRPLNRDKFIDDALASRGFQAIYSEARTAQWREANHCPQNDRACAETIWLSQTQLLGERREMDQIAEAVRKIRAYARELA